MGFGLKKIIITSPPFAHYFYFNVLTLGHKSVNIWGMNVSIRDFQLKAGKYLDDLPITLTRYGEPIAKVVSVDTQPAPKGFKPKKTEFVPKSVDTPNLGQLCSWDKTFKCTSPATVKVRGKWYCSVHKDQL